MNELERLFRTLSLEEIMQQPEQEVAFGVINKPPSFSGRKQNLEGFLTRAELAMESRPNQFQDGATKVRFLMSYMIGKPLEWASCLRRNNSLLLGNYQDFINELKRNFGDYTTQAVVANSKLCNLRQRKLGRVFEYISEFQRIAQCSDFNESAKIYMFIRGLKQPLREKLALINPNPRTIAELSAIVINIENLIKRNDYVEFYERREDEVVPMDVDLYRIKRGPNDKKYTFSRKYYLDNKNDYSEEKKKGLCFRCKQPGHLSFNCPNKIRPKNLRVIYKGKEVDQEEESPKIRRITRNKRLMLREINQADINQEKNNILQFHIKTNGIEEHPVKVLIDSGSDLNFIHPEVVKRLGIQTKKIDQPFSVSGLGYGISNISRETEK